MPLLVFWVMFTTTLRLLGFFFVPDLVGLADPVTVISVSLIGLAYATAAIASIRTPTTAPISLKRTYSSWVIRETG